MRIEESEGWRLVVDPSRSPYSVLVGGPFWAAELTPAEATALRRGVARLLDEHQAATTLLMAEESIQLELELELQPHQGSPHQAGSTGEAGGLWVGLEGNRDHWEIRFVLTPPGGDCGARAIEGGWPASATAGVTAALLTLQELNDG